VGERRTALEELRMLFARARAPFVINMWEGEAKVGCSQVADWLSMCILIDLLARPRLARTEETRSEALS